MPLVIVTDPTSFAIQVDASNNQLASDRVVQMLQDAENLVLHEWGDAGTPYPPILATIVRNAAARAFYNPSQDEQITLGEVTRRPGVVYLRAEEKQTIAEARRRKLGVNAPPTVRSVRLLAWSETL